jgi:hypothetical protein
MAGFAAFAANLGHVLAVTADRLAAFAANLGHVLAVTADHLAAFASGLAGFLRCELVGGAFLVSGAAALTGYLALFLVVHRAEATTLMSLLVGHGFFSLSSSLLHHVILRDSY